MDWLTCGSVPGPICSATGVTSQLDPDSSPMTLGDIRAARERFVHTEVFAREHLAGIPEDDVVKVAD
ncbi:hypothetical protein HerbRD11066_32210 [Herbidospora sp. RD11066]